MKITVDTQKDSREEIREVIELLQKVANITTEPLQGEASSELAGLAAARDLFGNEIKDDDDEKPTVKVEKDEEKPEIKIVPY